MTAMRAYVAITLSLSLVFIVACSGDRQNKKAAAPKRTASSQLTTAAVKVIEVRLAPFRTATGIETQIACVDWQNNGDRPIRVVDAKLRGYDEQGNEVQIMPSKDYTIYAVFNSNPGIAPGATHIPPEGEGFVLPRTFGKMPVRATATITKVAQKGMD